MYSSFLGWYSSGRIILTYSCKSNGLHKRQKVTHAVAQLPPMDIHTVRGS